MATKISNVLYVKVGNVTVTKLENQKKTIDIIKSEWYLCYRTESEIR
jgi:hypothetical protein